jgi:hypothetical protein
MGIMEKAPVVRRMERRNWWILGALLAASVLLLPLRFTAGVAAGGVLSILGFHTLEAIVSRILRLPAYKARARIVAYHYARLGVFFGILALVLGLRLVDPLALVIGLSVVVMNLILTTVVDHRKIAQEV